VPPSVGQMTNTLALDLPPEVRLVEGQGGLPCLHVDHQMASGELYLDGATVTAWQPHGHDPVLWRSPQSQFVAGHPIRGGVPLCFPWFAAGPDGEQEPAHGFARIRRWELVSVTADPAGVQIRCRLTDDATSRQLWPHRFTATYDVQLGQSLQMALTVRNTGSGPLTFEEAMHTYLAVGDVAGVSVHGLARHPFVDKAGPEPERRAVEHRPLRIAGPVDRLYHQHAEAVHITDANRTLTVGKAGSQTTVIWNPWAERAKQLSDLGDDDWPWFLCVESANAGPDTVSLGPGQEHRMGTSIQVR